MDKLLTVNETAALLDVSDRTLQRKIKAGAIAAVEVRGEGQRGGRSGVVYMVPLEKLPAAVQVKYWQAARKVSGSVAAAGAGGHPRGGKDKYLEDPLKANSSRYLQRYKDGVGKGCKD